jgi:N4-gp56 family major capsid protein
VYNAYQQWIEETAEAVGFDLGGIGRRSRGSGLFGGAIDNFIPKLWSARIMVALQKALVYAQPGIVNRDFEGEINDAGDTVYINSIGDPTIFDYTKNTDMPAPETLTSSQKTLTITQAKAFNFQVDDVDKAQTRPLVMDAALSRAAYKLADVTDQYLAAQLLAGATLNTIGTTASPLTLTTTPGVNGGYENLVDLGTKLDEQNVPTEGRWVVVPPWFHGLLTKDSRFVSYAAVDVLYNRQVGEAAGFNILVSNNVPTALGGAGGTQTVYKILAGHQMAATYAEQINSVEAFRPERRFGDAVKGLHLYGAATERPEAVAVLSAIRS